jgi:hypothetical protein
LLVGGRVHWVGKPGVKPECAVYQVAAPDRAIETFCEEAVAFAAFGFTLGITAKAARRVSSMPLGNSKKEDYLGEF